MTAEPSNVCPTPGCGGYVSWVLHVEEGKDVWRGSCYGQCASYPSVHDGEMYA